MRCCSLLQSRGFLGDSRDRNARFAKDAGKLLIRQLEPLAQDLDLHLVSQIQRIAEMGWLRPVHDISLTWRNGLIATKRALRRSGRDGDYPAPREDSAAVEATVPTDRRSAIPGNISARSDLGVYWPEPQRLAR
jgi:hypothetical protein